MMSTVSIYFQDHPKTKHLPGDFCPAFAGILPASSGIPPCRDGIKKVPGSYKHNITSIKKCLNTYFPVYRPTRFFMPLHFSYKQPLIYVDSSFL